MNQQEAPQNDAQVLRLFREEDNLGADSSLWLRVLRQLTSDGKPIGRILAFAVPIGDGKKMPVSMLTLTGKNRLIFWPVLPRRPCCIVNKQQVETPDHVTVEFPSEKVHATSYSADGRVIHVSDSWRSAEHESSDLRLFFTFLVRLSVLEEQDVLISRKFLTPTNDKDRRTSEFARCANDVVMHDLPVPARSTNPHFVALSLYGTSHEMTSNDLPSTLIPMSTAKELVGDAPHDAEFPITVAQFSIRDQRFLLAAGFPPGQLIDELCFGFPRRNVNN